VFLLILSQRHRIFPDSTVAITVIVMKSLIGYQLFSLLERQR
jgi:hypothetical protein